MKLKTLKDIKNTEEETNRICSCGSTKESHGLEWIRESTIREEAIKRVKNCPCDDLEDPCDVCKREIWFNNLTEEDLK